MGEASSLKQKNLSQDCDPKQLCTIQDSWLASNIYGSWQFRLHSVRSISVCQECVHKMTCMYVLYTNFVTYNICSYIAS